MIKYLLLMCLLAMSTLALAEEKPAGFLWYNLPKEAIKKPVVKPSGTPFSHLSYTDKDAVLRFYTMEALHRARHTKTVKDMRVFLSLQDYWLKESSDFSQTFQKTMLYYPQYDYAVNHPTSSIGTKLLDETREQKRHAVIHRLAKTHGLLFFYRGNNIYDQKQIPMLRDFCSRFGLSLIALSVDGEHSPELPASRTDTGQADTLGVHFFPAVLLVNPKTQKTLPVAFGLTTQDVLEKRLMLAGTHFKGVSS